MSFAAMARARVWEIPGEQPRPANGFTLIELLTVIAIIGVLAAILIPTTSAVRVSAKRARTKVTFAQWAGAMELFRQEYGFYPQIDNSHGKLDSTLFAALLTGRTLDGSREAEASALGGNTKRLSFYSITEGDLSESRTSLADAFGNSEIAVLCDRDGDGRISAADGTVVAVASAESGERFSPSLTDLDLSVGVRAGVIFYSAGNGRTPSDLVLSWK